MPWMSINRWKKKHGIGKVKPQKKAKGLVSNKEQQVFKLVGYDTFSNEWYKLKEFATENEARIAGIKRLEELAISQSTEQALGQSFGGVQDQVYIEYPDGKRFRVIG